MFCIDDIEGLLYDGVDVSEVASVTIVIESVANDEVIGNFEAAILNVEFNLEVVGLYEKSGYVYFSRMFFI